MGKTTALRREIEKLFVPFAVKEGFYVDRKYLPVMLCFYRIRGKEAHLFDIQWEKYGRPRFVVNFGVCPAEGVEIDGKHFAASEMMASWTREGGRLQPRAGTSSSSWFRQDKPFLKRLFTREPLYRPDEIAVELLGHFIEIEMWWLSRMKMSHLHMRAYPGI